MGSSPDLRPDDSMLLVFVHLGSKAPRFLIANLSRLSSVFRTKARTVLVSDHEINRGICETLNIGFVKFSRDAGQPWPETTLDKGFRGGYWSYTSERFKAFAEAHQQVNPHGHAILCESDVLLLPNFPFDELRRLEKISWTVAGAGRDVGATLVSQCASQSSKLATDMSKLLRVNLELTDMQLLYKLRTRLWDDKEVGILPVWHPDLPAGEYGEKDSPFDAISTERFSGFFDGAHLGVWLTGGDPRSFWGVMRHFHLTPDNNYLALGRCQLKYENGLLYVVSGEVKIPLYTVHVHSKQSSFFDKTEATLLKLARSSQAQKILYRFSPKASLTFVYTWLGIYRRGLIRLFGGGIQK